MTAPVKTVDSGTGINTKGDIFASFDVADFDVPHSRAEEWRFVSLRRLRGLHDGTFAEATDQDVSVTSTGDVTVETLDKNDERLGRTGAPTDRVAAQAWTSMDRAQYVSVPKDTKVDEPIVVTVTGRGEGVTSFGATSVNVEQGAEATVILRYEGTGTHADNIEFVIGDNASLNVVVDAEWDTDAVHLSSHRALVGRDAKLHHTVVTFGGEVVRITPRVNYSGPGGDAELLGLYFADSGQYIENRMLVDHSIANCSSHVLYKGALQADSKERADEARTCWVGDVLIRSNAQNTDTYETNRNLVLTENARADAIPNLEIETGEIAGAGHAATVGRFDDEHMFYLRSRGIPEDVARRMIIRGFFSEVINRIPVDSVREELENRVATELERTNS
ncbi:Fe-S cluster assembly protein SufD [Corynebacterium yudongzhengii]|uniref:Fe-S cluster assembly protein SufD n=1 Tax=Corynebacterium yudongzhengii TaxID=2080740 RepID=A0A2U1T8P9_9CORY|nr:Fe-S cluster assembly protein SufD [Corynebacterium yudongzhengii]AWB81866.1 Fe-S cluster assembly protein SufD [Corynebacterium yudongzhengii]PWC02258.1 Fe-S cluster assembly protein SufD [Corynebacterium yudongzhengii]